MEPGERTETGEKIGDYPDPRIRVEFRAIGHDDYLLEMRAKGPYLPFREPLATQADRSFSVHAAAGGAAETWSVDLSNTYLAWAGRNLALNGLRSETCPLIKSDVSTFLDEAGAAGRTWDLIVADPPTYSNSKSTDADLNINRDWPWLVSACLTVLEPGGSLFFSSNSRKLVWDADLVGGGCEDISASTIPPDFRNVKIHRTWRIFK